jgi:hypothetical protein
MGRAGIEPATLGLRVDPAGFACSQVNSQGGFVRRNRFFRDRAWWRDLVDLLLTHSVSKPDNMSPHDRQCTEARGRAHRLTPSTACDSVRVIAPRQAENGAHACRRRPLGDSCVQVARLCARRVQSPLTPLNLALREAAGGAELGHATIVDRLVPSRRLFRVRPAQSSSRASATASSSVRPDPASHSRSNRSPSRSRARLSVGS